MTIRPRKRTCALCGTEGDQYILTSFSFLESCDLDTRPPENRRNGLFTDVQQCRGCGYCAVDVSKSSPGAETLVKSSEYRRQLRDDTLPYLANRFLCMSMVNRAANDYAGAMWALVQAAWACDDKDRAAEAVKCRSKAADMLVYAEDHGQSVAKEDGAGTAILVDLLRRAGRVDDARAVTEQGPARPAEEVVVKVLRYQEKLIAQGDTGRHTVAEAVGDNEDDYRRIVIC